MEKIGLVPAAGKATRMPALPCSKEILPVAFTAESCREKMGPVSQNLLACFRAAECKQVYWVLNPYKLDIASYYSRTHPGLDLAYLVIEKSAGVPYSIDFAYGFTRGKRVMMGFGDIWLGPPDVFRQVEKGLDAAGADLALGLFPVENEKIKKRSDMVAITADGRITGIQVKPPRSDLKYSWALAVWQPRFTDFIHALVKEHRPQRSELHLGHLFQKALEKGLRLAGTCFDGHRFIDIGTPESWCAFNRSQNLARQG